ncbi:protein of unknown function [Cupriavidus taiwanensis]|nr:protein of unknown function [Cupriavidus taiwanensis]
MNPQSVGAVAGAHRIDCLLHPNNYPLMLNSNLQGLANAESSPLQPNTSQANPRDRP